MLYSPSDDTGPDMSQVSGPLFEYRCVCAEDKIDISNNLKLDAFLLNEIGSVHLSFTRADPCLLLVLWSGSHAYVQESHYPPQGVIPMLPDDGE
jgi:hypothetical protein